MARVAGARVTAGARAAWRLAGLNDFRTAGRVLGQTPKGRFDLPSVCVRFAPYRRAKMQKSSRLAPGSLTFLPRATFTYCVNVVAAPRPGGHYVAG